MTFSIYKLNIIEKTYHMPFLLVKITKKKAMVLCLLIIYESLTVRTLHSQRQAADSSVDGGVADGGVAVAGGGERDGRRRWRTAGVLVPRRRHSRGRRHRLTSSLRGAERRGNPGAYRALDCFVPRNDVGRRRTLRSRWQA
jgi:hypothetical protein